MHLGVSKLSFLVTILTLVSLGLAIGISAEPEPHEYLPALFGGDEQGQQIEEVRALWVTRFDWMEAGDADPAKIDELVTDASAAGFNVLYFQVRGEADAYYTSDIEPWSRRLTGTLGQDPGWDPLGRLIERAHAADLQVHAYINVYPLWTGCEAPPEDTTPRHLFHLLSDYYGTTDGKLNGVQWSDTHAVYCSPYFLVSPASVMFENHLLAVAKDLVGRYDVDGIHLDHIRYADEQASCDPVSEQQSGTKCFASAEYANWQRQQINSTVNKLYEELIDLKPHIWLTSAVWPVYRDIYGWNVSSAFDSYYQDPKAWLTGGYIDAVSPMIYSDRPDCSRPYFWTRERWALLVSDYVSFNNGRFIIPGIGVNYCTDDDFAEIEARIELARAEGTAGHAVFSYSSLKEWGFLDDLAAGPYAVPARVPSVTWH